MAPSPSPDGPPVDRFDRLPGDPPDANDPARIGGAGDLLIDVADEAIRDGLAGRPLRLPAADRVPVELRRPAATFVTLHVGDELNGCIGSLAATEPLVRSVARHAWSAAFEDPRLPHLTGGDLARLHIEVSILSPLELVQADHRAALIGVLRRGSDGLLIDVLGRRAVFLPSVWATLPTPAQFVAELFAKAGLDPEFWGTDVEAWTFTTEKVRRGAPGHDAATVR